MSLVQRSGRAAVLVATFAALALLSCHRPCGTGQWYGTASYYTPPYEPSACYGFEEQSGMFAAASETYLWEGGSACGKSYRVRCMSGTNDGVDVPCKDGQTVTVRIVDMCPANSCQATIDLSNEAFAQIADPKEGIINIYFEEYVQN
ncbi:unnamed protein product [Linum trigynum]|uniref:Expansin-like EG45 domain-containing protein n=2 Tax=Linum trigynum TaxID=586398 RepID=A0AAV2EJK8_9ROSI